MKFAALFSKNKTYINMKTMTISFVAHQKQQSLRKELS
jgi:hypothetical protein